MLYIRPIISINVDAKLSNLLKLDTVITAQDPILIAIQDVPTLSLAQLKQTCQHLAPDYKLITAESMAGSDTSETRRIKRQHLILVSNSVHDPAPRILATNERITRRANNSSKATTMIIEFTHHNMVKYKLASVYVRPRSTWQELKACLELIETTVGGVMSHLAIVGDFNASNTCWSPTAKVVRIDNDFNISSSGHYVQQKLIRGRYIATFYQKHKLNLLNLINRGPTFSTSSTESYTDLAFIDNKGLRVWDQFELVGISSEQCCHKALVISSSNNTNTIKHNRRRQYCIIDNINEQHFDELKIRITHNMITNWHNISKQQIITRMNNIADMVQQSILNAQNKVTIVSNLNQSNKLNSINRLNRRNRSLMSKMNKLESRAKQLRRLTSSVTSNKNRHTTLLSNLYSKRNKLRSKIITLLNRHNNMKDDTCTDLWRSMETAWTIINPNNHIGAADMGGQIDSQAQIDQLAEDKFPYVERVFSNVIQRLDKQNLIMPTTVTLNEVQRALKEMRNKQYTGPDGIKFQAFLKASMYILEIIATICYMSFVTNQTPLCCQETLGTLIPKKTPGQYRIVHVSAPLAVLIEQVALHRLEHALESQGMYNRAQYGFTALRSRHDLVTRVIELVLKGRRDAVERVEHGRRVAIRSTIVSLDIKGAFDNVNQDLLVNKLLTQLGEHTIKYWLANFTLNRNIRIKHNNLISKPRQACLGVPQGSCLGPILWNHMINELDKTIRIPKVLEVLAYADDLLIVHNQNNKHTLQNSLNELNMTLANMSLHIEPDKCSVLTVRDRCQDKAEPKYKINNIPLKNVKTLSILGIPITRDLRLDTSNKELRAKILNNANKLNQVKQLNLINSTDHWQLLIEGYIYNLTHLNLIPILAIDKRGREWCDSMHVKLLKYIFDWPSNCSNKVVQLLTGCRPVEIDILRLVQSRVETEHKSGYLTLEKILKHNTNDTCKQDILNVLNLGPLKDIAVIPWQRRYANPSKFLMKPKLATFGLRPVNLNELNQLESVELVHLLNVPTWIVTEGNAMSIFAETFNTDIIQIKAFTHSAYPTSYFNSLAGMLQIVKDNKTANRNITLTHANGLLQALLNHQNHDQRIIELRERMVDNNWQIYLTNTREMQQIQTDLRAALGLGSNELDIPPTHITTTRVTLPTLQDYKWLNMVNKWHDAKVNHHEQTCHTIITQTICPDIKQWHRTPPNYIKSSNILMLTGLHTDSRGRLQNTTHNSNTQDNNTCCDTDRTTQIEIIHRATECTRYTDKRINFMQHIGLTTADDTNTLTIDTLTNLFKNTTHRVALLKYMTDCAL